MSNHDSLIREIEATISICGPTDTARALEATPSKLRAILKSGNVPPEVVEKAREIGLVPAP